MPKKLDLKWFQDREMDTIIRIDKDGNETEKEILNAEHANYYHSLQESGFSFKDKIKIHNSPPTGCASCEG